MPHNHSPDGEGAEEIHAYANSILRNGKPLAKITDQGQSDDEVWATCRSEVPIVSAELNFTRDKGKWQIRNWETTPAVIDKATGRATASIPKEAKVFYLNIIDERQCIVSTEHIER